MKKIFSISLLLIGVYSGYLLAGDELAKGEDSEGRTVIESLIAKVEGSAQDELDLNRALRALNRRLLDFRNTGSHYSPGMTRDMSMRLIRIFNALNDSATNRANKERIISIIGLFDKSTESHKFFQDILESGSERNRQAALRGVWPNGLHGDDVYDQILSLVSRGVLNKKDILAHLKKANSERAKQEIQEHIMMIEDVADFIGTGQLLSQYNDPELVEVVIDKYVNMREKWKGSSRYNPAWAIKTDLLVQCVERKEGKKFKVALEMLEADGTSGPETLPIMVKKLESNDAITREATLVFLVKQGKRGNIPKKEVQAVVERAVEKEVNGTLKKKAKKLLKDLL